LELRPRLQPDIAIERGLKIAIALERLGLPPGAIQREHELAAQALASRVRDDQALELRDKGTVSSEREVGLEAILERTEAQLLEPVDLVAGEVLVGEVGQGLASPQLERRPEALCGHSGISALVRLPSLAGEPVEAVGVHLFGWHLEHIASAARGQDTVAQQLAKARYVDLNGLGRRIGRSLAPQLVDHPIHRDDLAAVDQEDRQNRSLPATPQRHLPPVDQDLERAKNAEVHFAQPPSTDVTTGGTGRLPGCYRQQPRVYRHLRGCAPMDRIGRSGARGALMRNGNHRLRRCVALATVVGAVAAPAAWAAPVDPPIPGPSGSPGTSAPQAGNQPQAPYSSVNATAPPEPTLPSTPAASSVSGEGFDWGDAGIGAGAGFAVTMIGLGGALVISSRRRREPTGGVVA
jgi:hypothetical protein